MTGARQYVTIATPPASEAIDLAQAKLWLREDSDGQDPIIIEIIRSARAHCEKRTGRATVSTTYLESLDAFPVIAGMQPSAISTPELPAMPTWPYPYTAARYAIALMRSPLISVDSLKYYDNSGTQQTMDPADYVVDITTEPARIIPRPGTFWPATQDRPGAVQITYKAGYSRASLVAPEMKQAMRMLIAHWYLNREAVLVGTISKEIDLAVGDLLADSVVHWEW